MDLELIMALLGAGGLFSFGYQWFKKAIARVDQMHKLVHMAVMIAFSLAVGYLEQLSQMEFPSDPSLWSEETIRSLVLFLATQLTFVLRRQLARRK